MSAATDDPTGIPIPSTETYISERQRKEWQEEINTLERTLADPQARLQDPGAAMGHLRSMKKALHDESAPDVTPDQKDRVAREEQELRQLIAESMCSQEEMRKCPPGAIGKYRKGEFSPEMKRKIVRWKNCMRILHKGDDDPDISNIEMFRPTVSTLNMQNALIPGKDYFIPPATEQYKMNWEQTFAGNGEGKDNGRKAMLDRIAELERKIAESAPKSKPKPTDAPSQVFKAACGQSCRSNAGKAAHERACKACKAMAAKGEQE